MLTLILILGSIIDLKEGEHMKRALDDLIRATGSAKANALGAEVSVRSSFLYLLGICIYVNCTPPGSALVSRGISEPVEFQE